MCFRFFAWGEKNLSFFDMQLESNLWLDIAEKPVVLNIWIMNFIQ
jgi:hypothetical protein